MKACEWGGRGVSENILICLHIMSLKIFNQKALVGMLSSLVENVGSLLYGTKSFWKAMTQVMGVQDEWR